MKITQESVIGFEWIDIVCFLFRIFIDCLVLSFNEFYNKIFPGKEK